MTYEFFDFGNVQLYLWRRDDWDFGSPNGPALPSPPQRAKIKPERRQRRFDQVGYSIRFRFPQDFENQN